MTIAFGSASETEYHLLLAADLGYLSREDHADLNIRVQEVKRMLSSFIRRTKGGK